MNYNKLLKQIKSDYDKLEEDIKQNLSFDTYVKFILGVNGK
jgi:hypothetical protein